MKKQLWIRVVIIIAIFTSITIISTSIFAWYFVSNAINTLPNVDKLLSYEPILPSVILSKDGEKIGELFTEKRYPISLKNINPNLIVSFIASEDARFYEHNGVDLQGTIRASLHYIFRSGQKQGGSSISQQLAKNLLLTRDKTIERKIKDMALAIKMETLLGKDKILELYLNTIFLGNNSYGIEAASRNYFRKSNLNLSLAECSLIAGLAPAPSAYSPIENFEKAKKRQKFVLEQLVRHKKISVQEANEAYFKKLKIYRAETPNAKAAPYFFSEVKKQLEKLIPSKDLTSKGYQIYTTVDLQLQKEIQQILSTEMKSYQNQRSFKGALAHNKTNLEEAAKKISSLSVDENEPLRAIVVDIYPRIGAIALVTQQGLGVLLEEDTRWVFANQPEKNGVPNTFQNFLEIGDEINVLEVARDLPKRLINSNKNMQKIKNFASYLPTGGSTDVNIFSLADFNTVEGAAIVANAASGEVLAIVGGTNFATSQFNRATQAKRQIGSSIKPLYYSMALDEGFSPASLLDSPPIVIGDWRPENYSKEFLGRTTLRRALINSYNIASIQLAQALGLKQIVQHFARLGLDWDEKIGGFSLALGGGDSTLLQIAQAYTPFANAGKLSELYYINKIVDRNGKTIFSIEKHGDKLKVSPLKLPKNNPNNKNDKNAAVDLISSREYWKYSEANPLQVLSPEAAFITVNIMQDVIKFGTGTAAFGVSKYAAGKTGTTNNYTDAWFLGVLPNFVGGVWAGFDDAKTTLGAGGTGGKITAPIWRLIMNKVVEKYPVKAWPEPANISWVRTDQADGRILPGKSGGILLPMLLDTEPGGLRAKNALGVLATDGSSNTETNADTDDASALRYQ